jgi:pyridoxal phosphate enzyme (YggS family)
MTPASVADVAARADAVRDRIRRAGGDPEKVRLVAVTKGFDADAVRAALAAGLVDVGENYAQELTAKQAALAETLEPRWHFIGRLQSNKVRQVAPYVTLWQSVDRLSLGQEIARRAPGAAVLAQVNVSGESTKGGCRPEELLGLLDGLRALGLDVQGLMTVGPLAAPEAARPGFRELRRLADLHGLAVRSMGMSDDLEVAVEEGSTMVRVGSALFGPRPGSVRMRH